MKKFFVSFLSLTALISMSGSLSSCTTSTTVKTHLDYGVYFNKELKNINEIKELEYDELASKILHEDSFILVPYHEGCGCWIDFAPVLAEYINKYHVKVEYINNAKFSDDKDKFGLLLTDADMPAVCLFAKGKLQIELTYSSKTRDYFKSASKLNDFIIENAVMPKQYLIDMETLDSYIESDKEFNLYVSRTGCPDCAAAEEDVLKVWNYKVDNIKDNLYIFDLAPYYASSYTGSTNEEIEYYQFIKDKYGLSEKNNPILGYSTGMVPTFQRRKGNKILDMIVVLNDSQVDGVVSSYFTETRIKNMPFLKDSSLDLKMDGMQLTKSEGEDWRSYWRSYKTTYNNKYHYPILNLFISTYIK